MKKTTFILLCLIILLALASCQSGGNDSVTSSPDPLESEDVTTTPGASDPVETTTPPAQSNELEIVSAEGTTTYTIVRAEKASGIVTSCASDLYNAMRSLGVVKMPITTDWSRNPVSDYEIIIGQTAREGDDFYVVEREVLGDNGYIIKVIGNKILISGGTDEMTVEATKKFISMLPDKGIPFNVPKDLEIIYSKNATITDVKYSGVSLSEFELVYPQDNKLCAIAAETLRSQLFNYTGILLKVDKTGTAKHKFEIVLNEGSTKFSFLASGGKITISGSTRTGISRGILEFFDIAMNEQSGSVVIKENQKFDIDYKTFVAYEDFGAVGDGKTDDAAALRDAHNYANEKGLRVLAREDATYYIGPEDCSITIKTDTDWGCANFIIDDTAVKNIGREIFIVPSSNTAFPLAVSSLKAGQENIGVTLPCDCIVTAVNVNVRQYIRYGSNQDNGASMTDIFLVHADGSVDSSTPILWNFDTVTSISAMPVDSTPLMLHGGTFTTIANAAPSAYTYYYRGIRIYRSNVIVDGLCHYITGEGSHGAPYNGFLIFYNSVNPEIRNVTLTAHKTYATIGSAGTSVNMGSYDITVTNTLGFTARNCRQTTDILDTAYWGVFASNYSKNITFDGCVFSRFDAHKGVCNVTLLNSTFGHQGINLIGHGTALLEGCTIYSQYMVNLRNDYGSTWNGDLIIRNCTYKPVKGSKDYDPIIVGGSYTDTHDFGYTCYLPQNVIIDGLKILDSATKSSNTAPAVFANIDKSFNSASYAPKYPMVITENITVSNLEIASGKKLVISSNKYMFAGLEITYK